MKSVFANACFIKPDVPFTKEFGNENYAPMFRKKFQVEKLGSAKLAVCGLGYAYYFINGKSVSPDLFTAPVSHYEKTLWYNTYDVSDLLVEGENTVGVICGNGWYNEIHDSVWYTYQAAWRDLPKFILRLTVDGNEALVSDDSWKCSPTSAVRFNQLRSGEWFDATRYDENWKQANFDDSAWGMAKKDDTPPRGIFRECPCEPIREHEILDAQRAWETPDGGYLFDMGRNMSGYIRLTLSGHAGEQLTIRYGERLNDAGELDIYGLERFYPESDFQTDRFTCSGKTLTWSPHFAYHGFRFIEIKGLSSLDGVTVQAAFVHQAVRERTQFSCSDEFLNKLFAAGRASTFSNMFYLLSDCPTREKFGWTNDAQMSCEQVMSNLWSEKFFRKWLQDIRDNMREDGALPGIIPTGGWGYEWGSGTLSDGVIFEVPYRIWLHSGKTDELVNTLPYFKRYLAYIDKYRNENGLVTHSLGDWATAGGRGDIPVTFVTTVLLCKFNRIAALAAHFAGETDTEETFLSDAVSWEEKLYLHFMNEDGTCKIDKMSAVATVIHHENYRELAPLKAQLKRLVEENDFHHDCGILGLRCLYYALNLCGLADYAYRIVAAKGFPSYSVWFDHDATTLWEYFDVYRPDPKKGTLGEYISRNHHMYSDVTSWLVKTVLGFYHDKTDPTVPELKVEPIFLSALTHAEGSFALENGCVSVAWRRENGDVILTVTVEGEATASYRGQVLTNGVHTYTVKGE